MSLLVEKGLDFKWDSYEESIIKQHQRSYNAVNICNLIESNIFFFDLLTLFNFDKFPDQHSEKSA